MLWERNQRLAVESENLHVRAQALRKEREEYQNHRDEIEKELKALSIDISDKNSRMEGLQGEITSIKDEIDQNRNKINADSCRQEMLKDEIKQLKSQIITNPSELVQVRVSKMYYYPFS